MKLWLKMLIIGIVILFVGAMIPVNGTYGFGGMYVVGLGLLLIIGAIVALGRRLMGRMVSE
ncbi:MAG: hypothetical protein ACW9XA_07215 [Candidatus Nitrosopumilus sp. bin_6a]